MNENALNGKKEPSFIYRSGKESKMNIELVKMYPRSYMYREYMSDSRTADSDVIIDLDGENDELIVKYMKKDESLIEDWKKMNNNKRRKFIDDLSSLMIPIKKEFFMQKGCNEDKEIMKLWKERRVVMVNGENDFELNGLLKKRNIFDQVFNSQLKENSGYVEEVGIDYIDLKMNYRDVIVDCLKNKKINEELIKDNSDHGDADELMNEMRMIGIELDEEEKEVIRRCFDKKEPLFIYRSGKESKMNVELVNKYPGSYMYKEYMNDHRTADGDIFIDRDGENDELIMKYMEDDESLIEDMKKMSIEERSRFLDELSYLELPIKMVFISHLHCEKEETTEETVKEVESESRNELNDSTPSVNNSDSLNNMSELLPNSQLVSQQYDSKLREWIGDYKWRLIYRASEHGYTAESFHAYCDDKRPTLVVIKSSGRWIFGGYTTRSWNGNGIYYDMIY